MKPAEIIIFQNQIVIMEALSRLLVLTPPSRAEHEKLLHMIDRTKHHINMHVSDVG